MLSGKLPYEGEGLQTQLKARIEGRVVPIERRVGVPAAVADLLGRALASDPAARPADGAAIARELEAIEATLGQPKTPRVRVATPARLPAPSLPALPEYPEIVVHANAGDTKNRVLVAGAVLLAVVLGGAVFLLLRSLDAFTP